MVGITTYIYEILQRGQQRLLSAPTSAFTAQNGLAIGRYTDLLIQRAVAGSTKISRSNYKHRRALRIVRALENAGVTIVKTQTAVSHVGISTHLDGLGRLNTSSDPVVIEVKTTQHSMSEYRRRCKLKCKRYPQLVNGLPNSIETSYSLQSSFGALAYKKTFNMKTPVRALVVVGASDGAQVFWCDQTLQDDKYFPQAVCRTRGRPSDAIFQVWPTGKSDRIARAYLLRLGVSEIKRGGPGSGVGVDKSGAVVVIGVVGRLRKQRVARLGHVLKRLAIKYGNEKQKPVLAFLLVADTTSASGFSHKQPLRKVIPKGLVG